MKVTLATVTRLRLAGLTALMVALALLGAWSYLAAPVLWGHEEWSGGDARVVGAAEWVHVDAANRGLGFDGGGFTGGAAVDVHVAEYVDTGCDANAANALAQVSVTADAAGGVSGSVDLSGDEFSEVGRWMLCAVEGETAAVGYGFLTVAGAALAVSGDDSLGGAMLVSGAGFVPEQTVTVFAVPADDRAGCDEHCVPKACPPYRTGQYANSATVLAIGDGTVSALTMEIDPEGYAGSTQWGFCAVGGDGEGTTAPAHLHLGFSWGAGDAWLLQSGDTNRLWFWPVLDNVAISRLAVGSVVVDPAPRLKRSGAFSEAYFDFDLNPGSYTLTVEFDDGRERLSHVVTVEQGEGRHDWAADLSAVSLYSGDPLNVAGTAPASVDAVQVYGIGPALTAGVTECPAPGGYVSLGRGTPSSDGSFAVALDTGHDVLDVAGGWLLCVADGAGVERSEPLPLEVLLGLSVADTALISGGRHEVTLTPSLGAGLTVSAVTVSGMPMVGDHTVTTGGGQSFFTVHFDVPAGVHQLVVTLSDGTMVSQDVGVLPVAATDLKLSVTPEVAKVGDTLRVHGSNFASSLTVAIYAVSPDLRDSRGGCPSDAGAAPLLSAQADSIGEVDESVLVDVATFDQLGVWGLCAVDGAGEQTAAPGEFELKPGLALSVDELVRFVEYEVSVQPGLPPGVSIANVSLAGRPVPLEFEPSGTGGYPSFYISTELSPGRYELKAVTSDDDELTLDVAVVAVEGAPVLRVLGESPSFGDTVPFEVTGARQGAVIDLVGVAQSDGSGWACADVAALPESELGYVWTGTFEVDDGVWSGAFDVTVADFGRPSRWLFCVFDREAELASPGVNVTLRPAIVLPGDARVNVGDTVAVMTLPPVMDGDVTAVRLDGMAQSYTVAGGLVQWEVGEIDPGGYDFEVALFGETVMRRVTVLSPSSLIVGSGVTGLECPDMLEFLEDPAPGLATAVTLRFRVEPAGGLGCYVFADNGGEVSPLDRKPTTVLPSGDLRVELPFGYGVPASPEVEVMVRSFNNDFAHRYTARGVEMVAADREGEKHAVVIPGCGGWYDNRDNRAPCEVEDARDIGMKFSVLRLPIDASQPHPIALAYGDSDIWGMVKFDASVLAVVDEVVYGQAIELAGEGYAAEHYLEVYGLNTSLLKLASVDAGAEPFDETCAQVVAQGDLLLEVTRRETDDLELRLPTVGRTEMNPGRWALCVQSRQGVLNAEPEMVAVNYGLDPQTGGGYEGGGVAYLNAVPGLPSGLEMVQVSVDGVGVTSQLRGDQVRFETPVNVSGNVWITVVFNDELESEIQVDFRSPELTIEVVEPDGKVRVGTLLRLSIDRLSGDRVCDVTLGGVALQLRDDGNLVEGCQVVGANGVWRGEALVVSKDGAIGADLVDLFEVDGPREVLVTSSDNEEAASTVDLLSPSIKVTDFGEDIEDNVLVQFEPVLVEGSGFPRTTAGGFDGVSVGYEVATEKKWERISLDGEWSDEFRIRTATETGRRLEFIPLIGGHPLETLAFVLTVGVATPTVAFAPADVASGIEVEVMVTNLPGFVAGYRLFIVDDEGRRFPLSDGDTGELATLTSDGDGAAELKFIFPDYEAEFYDVNDRASLLVQLVNPAGEDVPEAFVRITHIKPVAEEPVYAEVEQEAEVEPVEVVPAPPLQPTAEPVAPMAPQPVLPTPTPVVVTPPSSIVREQVVEGPPAGVDHSRVTVEVGDNGTTVTLRWVEPLSEHPVEGYVISRAFSRDGTPEPVAVPHHGATPLYVDLNVYPDVSYWYYIISQNEYGLADGSGIVPVEARTPGAPSIVPRFERAGEAEEGLVFEWDAPLAEEGAFAPVAGYLIEAKAVAGESQWVVIARPEGNATNGLVPKFGGDGQVRYRIAAWNAVGRSPWQEWQRPTSSPLVGGTYNRDSGGISWMLWGAIAVAAVVALLGGRLWWVRRKPALSRYPRKDLRANVTPWDQPAADAEPAADDVETGDDVVEPDEDAPDSGELPAVAPEESEGEVYSGRLSDELPEVEPAADDGAVAAEAAGDPAGDAPDTGGRSAPRTPFVYPTPEELDRPAGPDGDGESRPA